MEKSSRFHASMMKLTAALNDWVIPSHMPRATREILSGMPRKKPTILSQVVVNQSCTPVTPLLTASNAPLIHLPHKVSTNQRPTASAASLIAPHTVDHSWEKNLVLASIATTAAIRPAMATMTRPIGLRDITKLNAAWAAVHNLVALVIVIWISRYALIAPLTATIVPAKPPSTPASTLTVPVLRLAHSMTERRMSTPSDSLSNTADAAGSIATSASFLSFCSFSRQSSVCSAVCEINPSESASASPRLPNSTAPDRIAETRVAAPRDPNTSVAIPSASVSFLVVAICSTTLSNSSWTFLPSFAQLPNARLRAGMVRDTSNPAASSWLNRSTVSSMEKPTFISVPPYWVSDVMMSPNPTLYFCVAANSMSMVADAWSAGTCHNRSASPNAAALVDASSPSSREASVTATVMSCKL